MAAGKITLTYIANSGVTVEYKNKKVLIDGVHIQQTKPYYSVSDKTLEKMLLNNEPFNNIDLMLFTHHHPDHFDAYAVNEILKRNKLTHLVGTPQVLSMLRKQDNYNDELATQIWPMTLDKDNSMIVKLKSVNFEITSLDHDGAEKQRVDNYTYLFEVKNKTFLHLGDAQANMLNFENTTIFKREVDVLIVPFIFIGLPEGRKIINRIKPQTVIVSHLPDKKYDTSNLLYKTYKVYKKHQAELPETLFLEKPGQTFTL